jgi:hypothetical protein
MSTDALRLLRQTNRQSETLYARVLRQAPTLRGSSIMRPERARRGREPPNARSEKPSTILRASLPRILDLGVLVGMQPRQPGVGLRGGLVVDDGHS